MITYTCDVCGATAVSSTKVDRYRIQLDLCEGHLREWVKTAKEALQGHDLTTQALDAYSRPLMDLLVLANSVAAVDPATQPQGAPADGAKGVQALHEIVDRFIAAHKA